MRAKTHCLTTVMALGVLLAGAAANVQADGSAIRTITQGTVTERWTPGPQVQTEASRPGPGLALARHPAVRRHTKPKPHRFPEDDPKVRECVAKASATFNIDPMPLYLLLDVEGGQVGKNSKLNRNGTYDIGKAQINSSHLRKLAARGISEDVLRNNLCVNILVQGWLFKDGLVRSKSVAKALALYHSPDPALQRVYLEKIDKAIARRLSRLAATP